MTRSSLHRYDSDWDNPREKRQHLQQIKSDRDSKIRRAQQDSQKHLMLEDFIYLNMKRVRHIHFLE